MAQTTGMQLSWVFCLVMFTGLAVVKIATPGVITDRYLIPIVPFVLAVALDREPTMAFLCAASVLSLSPLSP